MGVPWVSRPLFIDGKFTPQGPIATRAGNRRGATLRQIQRPKQRPTIPVSSKNPAESEPNFIGFGDLTSETGSLETAPSSKESAANSNQTPPAWRARHAHSNVVVGRGSAVTAARARRRSPNRPPERRTTTAP